MNRFIVCLVLLCALTVTGKGEEFSSGPEQTSLIELFTSEGCSSCPPAERRMNALIDDHDLWDAFVPIAFHVDYWNYLGWTDPYSSVEYSARQRRYAKKGSVRSVYTPCFVVNGIARHSPSAGNRRHDVGSLRVRVDDGRATITFKPTRAVDDELIAWLVPLSGKLSTKIKAGENSGRQLEHCFVALGLVNGGMEQTGNRLTATLTVPEDARTKALAVWISTRTSLKPIQAAGGWLKP